MYNRNRTNVRTIFDELTFFGLLRGGETLRADYIPQAALEHILSALTTPNELALQVSLCTGLRIDDVLSLKTQQLKTNRFTVTESKTMKRRKITLPVNLWNDLLMQAGKIYVFEGRTDPRKHRTRQAVYKDLKRAATLFRVKNLQISPHSARKVYAVNKYQRTCRLDKVRELLNHSDEAVTMLYAMADAVTAAKVKGRKTNLPS